MLLASRNKHLRCRPINSKLHYREARLVISLPTAVRGAHFVTESCCGWSIKPEPEEVKKTQSQQDQLYHFRWPSPSPSWHGLIPPPSFVPCIFPEVFSHIPVSRKLMTASGCGGVWREEQWLGHECFLLFNWNRPSSSIIFFLGQLYFAHKLVP